eukprot:scaffold1074_cov409-Prasinococcus_capsulatus_cf.AAC.8
MTGQRTAQIRPTTSKCAPAAVGLAQPSAGVFVAFTRSDESLVGACAAPAGSFRRCELPGELPVTRRRIVEADVDSVIAAARQ